MTDCGSGSGFQQYDRCGTPGGGESIDQNEVDEDEDDEDANEIEDEAEEEGNDEFVVQPTQPTFTQMLSQQQPQGNFSTQNQSTTWSYKENEALINCYMSISSDTIIGTNQKKDAFWGKVIARYEAVREANPLEMPYRSPSMIRGKWMRLARAIMKWVACYDKACARKKSGGSQDDVIREAQRIHINDCNKKFTLLDEWKLLENYPRWQPLVKRSIEQSLPRGRRSNQTSGSGSSGKRVRDDDAENEFEFDEILESPSIDRPEGIKKAKSRLRDKGKGKTEVAIEAFESFSERLQIHNERRGIDAVAERERLQLMGEKEARKQKQMAMEEKNLELQQKEWERQQFKSNWEMLQVLKSNPNREPYEQEMYEELVNWFRTHKRV